MNTQTVESPTVLPDEVRGYANELAAAQKRLQAPAADLSILLNLILKKSITRDQICDLLEKSWTHLQNLRAVLDSLCQTHTESTAFAKVLTEASNAAQSGELFSLPKVRGFLEEADSLFSETSCDTTPRATLAEAHALLSHLEREYESAAEHYQTAATVSTGDDQLQWRYQSQGAGALCAHGRESLDDDVLLAAIDLYETIATELTDEVNDP